MASHLCEAGNRKFRPYTKSQLDGKFGHKGSDYVARLIEDAKAHKRWRKDKFYPENEELHEYWVLDDEFLEMEFGMEVSNELTAETEMSMSDAQGLTGETGMFNNTTSITMHGFGGAEVARQGDSLFDGVEARAKTAPKSKAFSLKPLLSNRRSSAFGTWRGRILGGDSTKYPLTCAFRRR